MLTIDKFQNMTLTKGDTLTLTVALYHETPPIPPATEPTVEPYTPEEGDVIRFAVSSGYLGATGYELKYSTTIPHDTLTFTMPASETGKLAYTTYNYDVEITHQDGAVDTFISAKLTIVGEVK